MQIGSAGRNQPGLHGKQNKPGSHDDAMQVQQRIQRWRTEQGLQEIGSGETREQHCGGRQQGDEIEALAPDFPDSIGYRRH